jgi:hypothetical protein
MILSEKTYSTVALRCSLSSGVSTGLFVAEAPCPAVIANYCLPLTSKLIGGADLPQFVQRDVVVGRHGAIGQGKEGEPAGGGQRAAGVRIPQMDSLLDLAGQTPSTSSFVGTAASLRRPTMHVSEQSADFSLIKAKCYAVLGI